MPERARYESINSIFRVAGLKLVRPSVRALGTKGAMALALGLYAGQVSRSFKAWCALDLFGLQRSWL